MILNQAVLRGVILNPCSSYNEHKQNLARPRDVKVSSGQRKNDSQRLKKEGNFAVPLALAHFLAVMASRYLVGCIPRHILPKEGNVHAKYRYGRIPPLFG